MLLLKLFHHRLWCLGSPAEIRSMAACSGFLSFRRGARAHLHFHFESHFLCSLSLPPSRSSFFYPSFGSFRILGAIIQEGALISSDAAPGLSMNSLWHMKVYYPFFHMRYGGLICSKGLQSDRPKCRGMPADPRRTTECKTVSKRSLEWCENRRCLSSLPVTWMFL